MELYIEVELIIDIVKQIFGYVVKILQLVYDMIEVRKKVNNVENIEDIVRIYLIEVKDFFEIIRKEVDQFELIIDDEDWLLVKYCELFYIR